MKERSAVLVELVGGDMDGERWLFGPSGSVSLPQQFCFLSVKGDHAGWLQYQNLSRECTTWDSLPDDEVVVHYAYAGFEPFVEGERALHKEVILCQDKVATALRQGNIPDAALLDRVSKLRQRLGY